MADAELILLTHVGLPEAVINAAIQHPQIVQRIICVRLKDVQQFLFEGDTSLMDIHNNTGATITLTTTEQSAMDDGVANLRLFGSPFAVNIAHDAITDVITQGYAHVDLLPTVSRQLEHGHFGSIFRTVPLHQFARLFGRNDEKITSVEGTTGAWIRAEKLDIDQVEGVGYVRYVNIYGTAAQQQAVIALLEDGIDQAVQGDSDVED